MAECKYCSKELGPIRKIFSYYCCGECYDKDWIKKQDEKSQKALLKLKQKYIYRDKKNGKIKEKCMSLNYYEESKQILLNLINEWVDLHKGIEIINIETWQWTSHYRDQCEPWKTKITYKY